MIRVLIAEDEPLIAEAHRVYVDRVPGFTAVAVAHTARDAVHAATTALADGNPIDLVLLDIGLPDASGLDVAATLAGLRPSPDVIAITSVRDLATVRAAVTHGVALYLLKPFTFTAFRNKLDSYLRYRDALPTGGTALSQHDIDRALDALRTSHARMDAPKGVLPETLDKISRIVAETPDGLSATAAGRAAGVSRVTAWRYLEKLADDGLLDRHTEYGRAGRPQVRYTWRTTR